MIPRENLHKDNLLKFKGTYCRWVDVMNFINSIMPLTFQQDLSLQQSFRMIAEENIIVPLDDVKSGLLPQDSKGCRIHDWKVLDTPQIKNLMQMKGDYNRIDVPHVPFGIEVCENPSLTVETVEVYNKFLNVTYLVNDQFLHDWCNPYYEEKNIAKKKVKDCSVSELLFAVRQKIKQ